MSVTTTFDVTGYEANTASLSGLWGVDNDGDIFLNGVSTGITLLGSNTANFNVLHNFSVGSGFVAGINTLTVAMFDKETNPLRSRAAVSGFGRKVANQEFGRI